MTSNEQTNEYMAALGCHFIVCSLCFLIVIINNLALLQRELPCIRQVAWSCQEFLQKTFCAFCAFSWLKVDDAAAHADGDGLCAVGRTEFFHDVFDVNFHRLF